MEFVFEVRVNIERIEGKFAPRDEIEETLREAIEQADPGTVDGIGADGTSSYEIQDWEVTELPQPKRRRRP